MATGKYAFQGTLIDNTTTASIMDRVNQDQKPEKQAHSTTKGKADEHKCNMARASRAELCKHCLCVVSVLCMVV